MCIHSSERQQTIESALLQLGQFQLALEELLVWVKQTNATLDEQLAKNIQGDVKFIEVEKAKHKVRSLSSFEFYTSQTFRWEYDVHFTEMEAKFC